MSAPGFQALVAATGAGDLSKLMALRALVERANGDGTVERANWLTGLREEYRRWYAGHRADGHPENFPAEETVRYLDEHIVRTLAADGVLAPVVAPEAEAGPDAGGGVAWHAVRLAPWAAAEVEGERPRVMELLDARIRAILSHAPADAPPAAADSGGVDPGPDAPAFGAVDVHAPDVGAGDAGAGAPDDGAGDAGPMESRAATVDLGALDPGAVDLPPAPAMDGPAVHDDAVAPVGPPGGMLVAGGATLSARGLVKVYRKRRVVNDVDVHVSQGEIVGLLGPNGAGKTTSFYMMVGLIRPDKGKVFIGDRNLTGVPMYRRARAGIGYLAQEPSIFRKLTVEDNVMAILQMMKIPRAQRRQRLEQLLDELSIKHLRKTRAYALSGGERRRLEITRALVGNPKFMLLDEPFAGVDPIAVHDIQQIVSDLRRRGIGVLISDHNVEQTLDIVDRAYIMYDGRVRVSGTVSELVWNEEVAEIYLGPTLTARMRARYPDRPDTGDDGAAGVGAVLPPGPAPDPRSAAEDLPEFDAGDSPDGGGPDPRWADDGAWGVDGGGWTGGETDREAQPGEWPGREDEDDDARGAGEGPGASRS